jgi:hypothetical protein
MKITDEVRSELEEILDANDGMLRPVDVVDRARSEDSALHGFFNWNDSEAARLHRFEQARKLIVKVKVTILDRTNEPVVVRAYSSLATDRITGGGYRATVEILDNQDLSAQMLQTALAELAAVMAKYRTIEKLCGVRNAIKAAEAKM